MSKYNNYNVNSQELGMIYEHKIYLVTENSQGVYKIDSSNHAFFLIIWCLERKRDLLIVQLGDSKIDGVEVVIKFWVILVSHRPCIKNVYTIDAYVCKSLIR